jgi:hypothetical protein
MASPSLTPSQQRVVDVLRLTDRPVSSREIAAQIYGDRPEGGPEWAVKCVHVWVHALRRQGWQIRTHGQRGYILECSSEAATSKG